MLDKPIVRLLIFLLSLWIIGIALAFWFGLGWLFLVETLRRIVTVVPQIYIPILRRLIGVERADEEQNALNKKSVRLFYLRRGLNAIIWLILTIIVFLHANIRLIDLFNIKP